MLPFSHDEVVYGKNSILGRMPGDEWQRFANLRLLYGYMFTHPGTKLVFMGSEFGQYNEWDFQQSLDWNLLDFEPHGTMKNYFSSLNKFYKATPALYEKGFSNESFEWISYDDTENSVISYIRKGNNLKNNVLVVCNFTPNTLSDYRIGVHRNGKLKEIFNSDDKTFGGSGNVNTRQLAIKKNAWNNKDYSVVLVLPPLGMTVLQFK
jgi:1,4-alpha-glucan branching enzyme